MAWDLALDEHGDMMIGGHRDLLGRSGRDLIEQRMRIRLMVRRGSWLYDTDKTLGSNLWRLVGMSEDNASASARAYVIEALRGMDEINIDDVQVKTDSHSIVIVVLYRLADVNTGYVSPNELSLSIALPYTVAG